MHLLAQPHWQGVRGGLIHVPWLPEQGQPSMRLDEIVRGLETAIACALSTRHDIRKEAGAAELTWAATGVAADTAHA